MNRLILSNKATALFLVVLGLGCFCLSPLAQAVSPPPDGGYPGGWSLSFLTSAVTINAFSYK